MGLLGVRFVIKNTCSIGFIRLLFQSVQKIYFSCLPLSLWFITLGSLYILNVYSGDLFSSPEEAALVNQLIETYNETHEGSDCWIGFLRNAPMTDARVKHLSGLYFFSLAYWGWPRILHKKRKAEYRDNEDGYVAIART